MATSFLVDPLQMWRDAVTKLEGDVNALATGSAKYEEVVRTLHQLSGVSLGMEQVLEKVISGYLRRANLPSSTEVLELAESLRRIEDKLDRLLPADSAPAPRPPRTRRPSSGAPAIESATAPAPTPAEESALPRRLHASRHARASQSVRASLRLHRTPRAHRKPCAHPHRRDRARVQRRRRPPARASPTRLERWADDGRADRPRSAPRRRPIRHCTERLRLEVERALQRSLKGSNCSARRRRPSAGRRRRVLRRRGTMELVPLPRDRRRDLPGADPVRDGDDQQGLHPRSRAGPEPDRVPARARLRRLPDRLERADRRRARPEARQLRARLHPRLHPPGAEGLGRAGRDPDRLLRRRHAVDDLPGAASRRPGQEPGLLHDADRLLEDGGVPLAGGRSAISTSTSSSTASASCRPTSSSPASTRCARRAASPARSGSGTTSGTTSSSRATG